MAERVWVIVTEQVAETEKAVKVVSDSNYGPRWLPKSQIEMHQTSAWGLVCQMPYWLARQNWPGMRYGVDEQVVPHLINGGYANV